MVGSFSAGFDAGFDIGEESPESGGGVSSLPPRWIDLLRADRRRNNLPATSVQQWEYMKSICDGAIPPPQGMTKEQACEYVASQPSPTGLPQKAEDGITVLGERGSDYLTGAYSKGV
jgi:hypothetical protein